MVCHKKQINLKNLSDPCLERMNIANIQFPSPSLQSPSSITF